MDRIIKIAENNVAVTPSVVLKDAVGKNVEVYQADKAAYYGQNKIDEELEMWQSQKALYQDPKWIDKQIADCQAHIDKLAIIQESMDGVEQVDKTAGEALIK